MTNVTCSRRIISIAGLLLAAFATPAMALHTQSPPMTQVTQQTTGTVGLSTVWGDINWAFQASGDSLGTGNAAPELFLYQHDLRMLGGVFGLTQITCGGFTPNNPSMSAPSFGSVIAFDAIGTLCADGRHNCLAPFDASSTNRQIFAYYPETGRTRQLTNCPGDCTNPSLSENTRMIAFESTADVLGTNGGVPLSASTVYQGDLRQLGTNCPLLPCSASRLDRGVRNLSPIGGGRNASQNFTGRYVAFESDGDPTHNGANPGIPRIYVRDVKKNLLAQVPEGSMLPARNPTLDQGGHRVVYEMDVPRPGPSPTVFTEIWFSKVRNNRSTLSMSLTPGATGNSWHPSLGPTGRRVSFTSDADLLQLGRPGPQIYGYTITNGGYSLKHLFQITGGPTGADKSVQSSFLFAGLSSSDDLVGNGNTTPQFFVANLYRRAPGSGPSPLPGTPTPQPAATPRPTSTTPVVGIPAKIALALVTDQSINNNDNTLTTVIAATVSDFFSNPVPDGTLVHFSVPPPPTGIVVGNGSTNSDPDCDLTNFEQKTGVQIQNRPGVAHVCVTYPGALANSSQVIVAEAGPQICVGGARAGNSCTDDVDCTPIYLCSLHTSMTCNPLVAVTGCPGTETCERQDGACKHSGVDQGTLVLPVAHNDCLVNGQPCSDGNPCTLGDVCAGGTTAKACSAGTNVGLACTSDSQCPLGTCELTTPPICQPGAPKVCADDGNPCTDDSCNFLTGMCGTIMTCSDDQNPCTDDVCDPGNGACGVPNVEPCSDGDACTVGDECLGGTCQPGPPMVCSDDGNSCTMDVCNPVTAQCGIRFDPCACSAPPP